MSRGWIPASPMTEIPTEFLTDRFRIEVVASIADECYTYSTEFYRKTCYELEFTHDNDRDGLQQIHWNGEWKNEDGTSHEFDPPPKKELQKDPKDPSKEILVEIPYQPAPSMQYSYRSSPPLHRRSFVPVLKEDLQAAEQADFTDEAGGLP